MPNIQREQLRSLAREVEDDTPNENDTVKLWHVCPALTRVPEELWADWSQWFCNYVSSSLGEDGDMPATHAKCPLRRPDENCNVPFGDALLMLEPVETTLYGLSGVETPGRKKKIIRPELKFVDDLPSEILSKKPEEKSKNQSKVA